VTNARLGAGFDLVAETVFGGESLTPALKGATEEAQFATRPAAR